MSTSAKKPPTAAFKNSTWVGVGAVAVLVAWVGFAARARAQEPVEASQVPGSTYGYWAGGEARWFVSMRPEVGTPYAKPYVSAGYGVPHWIWAGVDTNAIVTPEFFQAYAGLRLASPIFDVATGLRDTWSFDKPFLSPSENYRRSDVLDAPGGKARYWAWESEVVAIAPLPYAALIADLVLVRVLDAPSDKFLYDESYRAVVADDSFFTLRFAAVARVLRAQSLKVGVLAEHVFGTGRGGNVTRLGPAASLSLTDHLDINATLTLAVSSPDDLGLALGAFGVAGIRYRWASGEAAPKYPWQGPLIP
jgi:hypothetical protein